MLADMFGDIGAVSFHTGYIASEIPSLCHWQRLQWDLLLELTRKYPRSSQVILL